jgi:hypothetical protein
VRGTTTRARGATAGALALLVVAGCAGETQPSPATPPPAAAAPTDGVRTSGQVTVTATVVAVDKRRRIVTLRGPEGNEVRVVVDPKVRTFDEIARGDDVTATYYESIALRLRAPGEGGPGIASSDAIGATGTDDLPAGVAVQATTMTATITAVDEHAQRVTVQGPRGGTRTLKVRDPEELEDAKVGDRVQVTYTEAVAVAVQKPEKPGTPASRRP